MSLSNDQRFVIGMRVKVNEVW